MQIFINIKPLKNFFAFFASSKSYYYSSGSENDDGSCFDLHSLLAPLSHIFHHGQCLPRNKLQLLHSGILFMHSKMILLLEFPHIISFCNGETQLRETFAIKHFKLNCI